MARSVGSIGIDVHPDTTGFNAELLKAIKSAERRNHIELPVDIDNRGIATKVRETRDRVEERIRASNIKIRIPVGTTNDEAAATEEARKKADRISNRLRATGTEIKLPVGFDADQVARELRKTITEVQSRFKDDLKLKVRVEFDESRMRSEWKRLKDDLNNDSVDLNVDLDRQGRARAQLAVLQRDRFVDLIVRINKRSLATAEATLAAISGENILRRAGRSLESFVQNLDSIAFSVANTATKFSTFSSAALASTSSILGLSAALGQLGGYTLTLPALTAGLVATGAAIKAAFSGFMDLMSSPASAINRIGKDIPEAMYNAALAMSGSWKKIQNEVKTNFWPQISGAFEDFARIVLPNVISGMGDIGAALGRFVKQGLDAVSSASPGSISSTFASITRGIQQATFGVQPLVRALLQLTEVGAKRLPDMGRWFADMAETFNQWVARSEANGNLSRWMENASAAAHDLGQSLIGIKGTLSGLVSAARDSGGGDLQTFAATMMDVRRAVESNAFQDTMRNLFTGAHEAIASVKSGLKDLGVTLVEIAPTLRSIMKISGETVGNTISQIADALKSKVLQSGAVDFFQGVRDGLRGMLDYLPSVARGLGNVGTILGSVFTGIGPTVGALFGGVADTFSDLTPVLKELVPILTNFSATAVGGLVDALQILSVPLKAILELFEKLPGFVQTALLALLLLKRFTAGNSTNPFLPMNRSLQQVPGNAQRARRALAQPLGAGFLDVRSFQPAFQAIAGIPGAVVSAYRQTYSRLSSANIQPFDRLVSSASRAVTGIRDAFSRVFSGVASGASSLGNSSFLQPYKTLGQDIARAVQSGMATVVTAARQGGMLAAEAFSRGFSELRGNMRVFMAQVADEIRRGAGFADITRAASVATAAFDAVRYSIQRIPGDMRIAGQTIAGGFAAGFSAIRQNLGQLPSDFRFAGSLAASAMGQGFAAVRGFIQSHLQLLANEMRGGQGFMDMQRAGQAMANTFASGWGGLRGLMSQFITPAMTGAFEQVRQAASSAGQRLSADWLRGVGVAMRTDLEGLGVAARGLFSRMADNARADMGRVGNAFRGLPGIASGALSGIGGFARTAFNEIVNHAQAAGRGAGSAFSSATKAIGQSFSGLWSFIGGGWGAAFAVGFIALDKIQAQNRKILQSSQAIERSYRNIAEAAAGAGQAIGDMASQEAAMRRLLELRNQLASEKGIFGGEDISVFDLLRQSGLGDQEFIDLMTGQGGEAARGYIEGLQNQLARARGELRNDWNPFSGIQNFFVDNQLKPTEDALNGIKNGADDAKRELDAIWQTKYGRGAAIASVLDEIAQSGEGVKVSLDNIKNIQRDVFGNAIAGWESGGNKITQFATAFSTSMGGSTTDLIRHFNLAKSAINSFQTDTQGGKAFGDVYDYITRSMVKANAPTANITKALTEMGLSSEEAANKIKFVWGPAVNEFGNKLQVNGELVPKLYETSNGVREFALALGAASNINPDNLYRAISLNGFDPAKFAPSLIQYGVGIDQIRAALQAMGVAPNDVGLVLAGVAEAAGKLNASGVLNPLVAQEFSEALQSIRDSADGAADKASALQAALFKLIPGKDAFNLGVTFADARRELEGLTKAADDGTSGMATLAQAFDTNTGQLDASVKGIGDVNTSLENFAQAGLAKAIQAYQDEMKVSGDSVAARKKMRDSIAEMGPVLDGLRSSLEAANGSAEISDQVWNNFLTTLGLTPDQIEILAIAQTDGAVAQLAELSALLHSVPPGVSVRATALTEEAAGKLQALGLIVEKGPDGVYTVKTSADPTTAQGQLQAFQDLLRNDPITAEVSIHVEATKQKIIEQLSNLPVSADVQAKIDTALQQVNSLNGTPIYADASAIIDRAAADISQLNGTNIEADAGAIIDRALADIARLNGTSVTASAGADIRPGYNTIMGLNGTPITIWAGANTNPSRTQIGYLNGMPIYVNAGANTSAARSAIDSLSGRNVYVNLIATGLNAVRSAFSGIFGSANGNLALPGTGPIKLQKFANGGVESHVAQIAPAGSWRVWAEPETGGEAYIPLSPSKRARSLKILGEVASRFGYMLTKANAKALQYASGGFTGGPATATSGGATIEINQYYPQTEKDSVAVTRAAQLLAARGLI